MDLNKFTEKAQQALAGSQKLAARMNNQQIEPEHLLLSLLDQEKGLTAAVLNKAGVSVDVGTGLGQDKLVDAPHIGGCQVDEILDGSRFPLPVFDVENDTHQQTLPS